MAINAGVDMDMIDNYYPDNISNLITNGELDIKVLDTAVLRILETKLRFGLFENPIVERKNYDINRHLSLTLKIKYFQSKKVKNIVAVRITSSYLHM